MNSTTSLSSEVDTLVTAVGDYKAFTYVFVASLTVFIWDIVLTLPKEMEFVWRARLSVGKLMYIVNRYGVLAVQISLVPFYLRTDLSPKICEPFFLTTTWVSYFCLIPVLYVVCARTYALYEGSKIIKWILIASLSIEFALVMVSYSLLSANVEFTTSPITGLNCYLTISVPRKIGLISNLSGLQIDLLWTVLSAYRIYQLQKLGRTKLVLLLFGDNLLYIVLVTTYTITAIFLYLFVPERRGVLQLILNPYAAMMPSVVTSHILLHLRAFTSGGPSSNRTLADVDITTIGFREFEEGASQRRAPPQVQYEMDDQPEPFPPLISVSVSSPHLTVADPLSPRAASERDKAETQLVSV